MKVAGLVLARDEGWCLGLSVWSLCRYADAVVFTDHGSNDGSADIVRAACSAAGKELVYIRHEPSDGWAEMNMRQEALEAGRRIGADMFVIQDADELLTGNLLGIARVLLEQTRAGGALAVPMVSTYGSPDIMRLDGSFGRGARLTWGLRDDGQMSWVSDAGYQHHMRAPRGCASPVPWACGDWDPAWGGVFHLQFLSRARLAAKAVWYKLMESVAYPGRMSPADLNNKYDWTVRAWDSAGSDVNCDLRPVPGPWWSPYRGDAGPYAALKLEVEPWQAREARRLVAAYGRERFQGLTLYDVA